MCPRNPREPSSVRRTTGVGARANTAAQRVAQVAAGRRARALCVGRNGLPAGLLAFLIAAGRVSCGPDFFRHLLDGDELLDEKAVDRTFLAQRPRVEPWLVYAGALLYRTLRHARPRPGGVGAVDAVR